MDAGRVRALRTLKIGGAWIGQRMQAFPTGPGRVGNDKSVLQRRRFGDCGVDAIQKRRLIHTDHHLDIGGLAAVQNVFGGQHMGSGD